MALFKTHEQAGYTAEYWFLKQLSVVRNGHSQVMVSLEPYKDASTRATREYAVGFPTPQFDVSSTGETEVTLDGEVMTRSQAIAKLGYEMIKDAAAAEAVKPEPTQGNEPVQKDQLLASFVDAENI